MNQIFLKQRAKRGINDCSGFFYNTMTFETSKFHARLRDSIIQKKLQNMYRGTRKESPFSRFMAKNGATKLR